MSTHNKDDSKAWTSPPQHRTLFILIDGLGDVTIPAETLASALQTSSNSSAASSPSSANGGTPLQVSHLPHLDHLVRHGLSGLLDSVECGQACGSDTAHLSLLGYDPLVYYRGRGAFESMGSGLDMRPGDIAFKSNFATLDTTTGLVVKRRADRAFHEWGQPLCQALDGIKLPSFPEVEVAVRYATEHRCGVRLRSTSSDPKLKLTDAITGTDPLVDGKALQVCRPTDSSAEAVYTCRVVNELSKVFHQALSSHPLNLTRTSSGNAVANVILLRGAGARIRVTPFAEAQDLAPGKACMVAPTAIIAGLGKSVGFDILPCPEATGDYRTNLIAKARVLLAAMRPNTSPYPFGFLHIKAVDDAGHDRDVRRKVEFLQKTDEMIGFILNELKPSSSSTLNQNQEGNSADTIWTIVVTGDHSTPVIYGDHSCEPVPFLITTLQHLPDFSTGPSSVFSSAVAHSLSSSTAAALRHLATSNNPVRTFDELACSRGVLGRFPGREVMPLIRKMRKIFLGQDLSPSTTTDPATSANWHHLTPSNSPSQSSSLSPQLQSHPLQDSEQSSNSSSSSHTSLIRSLPISPSCQRGISPWQEEFASVLPSFSPSSSTPFPISMPIVIIGAGLSGLSTAFALVKAGHTCCVLERELIGAGATGRNGGHMHPCDAQEEETVRKVFRDLAEFRVSEEDVDFRQKGGLELVKKDATVKQVYQVDHTPVPKTAPIVTGAELESVIHSGVFSHGVSRATAGSIHPVKLLVAYAKILTEKFPQHVQIWQNTQVTSVTPSSESTNLWQVETSRGRIESRVVIHATNAWASSLIPSLRGHVIPVRNHVIQTTPIVLPDTSSPAPVLDGLSLGFHSGYDYLIQRPNHRMILGGMRYLAPQMDTNIDDTQQPLLPYVVERMQRFLPQHFPPLFSSSSGSSSAAYVPPAAAISHLWSGILGFTSNSQPLIGSLSGSPGQFLLVGFSGHGMPRCPWAAERIAEQVTEYLKTARIRPETMVRLPVESVGIAQQPNEELLEVVGVTKEELQQLQQPSSPQSSQARSAMQEALSDKISARL